MKIPKKYQDRVERVELFDESSETPWLIYFKDGWAYDEFDMFPCRDKKEVLEIIKAAEKC